MGTITVLHVDKPAHAVAPAEARVRVDGTATWDEVVDAGLAALHEPRHGLFGYGVRGQAHRADVTDATVTVYANRD